MTHKWFIRESVLLVVDALLGTPSMTIETFPGWLAVLLTKGGLQRIALIGSRPYWSVLMQRW